MYIVDYCAWYDHDCGYDPDKGTIVSETTVFLDLWPLTGYIEENVCPGLGQCSYGEIMKSGYSLFNDRFAAREYYKHMKSKIKDSEHIFGDVNINFIKDERSVVYRDTSI